MKDDGLLPLDSGKAKILLYDLETSPNIGATWGTWETDVVKVLQHRQIISIAWKWLGDTQVYCLNLASFPGYKKDKRDNRALIERIHALHSAADIVVGHNVKRFDDRRCNTDMFKHKFTPPPPHKSVDTLEFAKFKFDFNSNRLDDLGEFLGLGRKVKHPGIDMWLGCMDGNPESWDQMRRYNIGDVVLLEKIYLRLRPWMQNHPNVCDYGKDSGCPACGKAKLKPQGYRVYVGGRRPRFQCQECGKWCSGFLQKDRTWKFR